MVNIYVGNLPYTTSESDLQQSFEAYGAVSRTKVIMDRETGKSRGFGFVEMPNDGEAEAAITALHGADFGGRRLVVNKARPKPM
jgi:cold-inducible RNA-binding protein